MGFDIECYSRRALIVFIAVMNMVGWLIIAIILWGGYEFINWISIIKEVK